MQKSGVTLQPIKAMIDLVLCVSMPIVIRSKRVLAEDDLRTARVAIDLPTSAIAAFCRKWQIQELALFGSVLSDDFDPNRSDIDILYSFQPGASVGWEIFRMKEELEAIFNSNVDLVRKEAILKSKNPYRRQEILDSYEVIHEQD